MKIALYSSRSIETLQAMVERAQETVEIVNAQYQVAVSDGQALFSIMILYK